MGWALRRAAAGGGEGTASKGICGFNRGESERQRLASFNSTGLEYAFEGWVHELFERRAAEKAGAVALRLKSETLSYGELNRWANRLARQLRGMGVGPDVLVGVCMERSFELMAALLGILKAGGAYVPLDPEYPLERLRYMAEDANAPVLLVQSHLRNLLPDTGAKVIVVSREDDCQERRPNWG